MDESYRDGQARARGSGSIRERKTGVWEIRVVVANDPHTGRSIQRSFTMHGDADTAEAYRSDLVERFGVDKRALYFAGARWSVAELLARYFEADHQWKPATWSSNRSVGRFLASDRLAGFGLGDRELPPWRRVDGSRFPSRFPVLPGNRSRSFRPCGSCKSVAPFRECSGKAIGARDRGECWSSSSGFEGSDHR